MTLTEVLMQLAEIRNKVTSTHIPTNITKIDPNISGDWKDWNIKFHTEEEDKIRKETIKKACDLLLITFKELKLPYDFACGIIDRFRQVMEEQT